ncbi:MAG TPA: hypothetical protein VFC39_03400 [Acidobacteriaceae bacterium]|nr:hypothetical protein [Acidobacteriaceae bacterium]
MKQSLSLLPLLSVLAVALTGCSSLQTLSITPTTVNLTEVGQTAQYQAIGTYQMGSASPTSGNATGSVNWTSSLTEVATIDSKGLATATGPGTTSIMAEANGKTATSELTVTLAAGTVPDPVLTVIPSTGLAIATAIGDTIQFVAYGNLVGGGPSQDLSSRVTWVSSNAGVATIGATGLATAKGIGNTIITAEYNGKTVTSDMTVSTASVLPASLAIIPALGLAQATRVGETTQFLAFGTLGNGTALQDLTNQVRWVSSDVSVATINQAGLATGVAAVGQVNTTTITAIATTSTGSALTQTSSLEVIPTTGSVTQPTLALYKVGAGTGIVTSSPAGVSCGPQATCTGNFSLGTSVTLTAVPDAGSSFGGWSSNCAPASPNSPAVPNLSCTVTMGNNTSVGAIFNKP